MVKRGEISESLGYEYKKDRQKYWEFHVDDHGKEHTVQFGIQDWWISDYMNGWVKDGRIGDDEDFAGYRI